MQDSADAPLTHGRHNRLGNNGNQRAQALFRVSVIERPNIARPTADKH